MATININAEDFESTVTDNDIVLVDFWADWCGPCKRFAPIYEKASEEHSEITFAKLDTDANQSLLTAGHRGHPDPDGLPRGRAGLQPGGALPGPALMQVIDVVKGLDMVEVHAQVVAPGRAPAPLMIAANRAAAASRSASSTTSTRGHGSSAPAPTSWATGCRSTMVWLRPIPVRLTRTGTCRC